MDTEIHRTVGLADAKSHLSELIAAVEAGEVVNITRRGRPVATVSPVQPARRPVDVAWLQSVADSMPYGDDHAGDAARMRDAARY